MYNLSTILESSAAKYPNKPAFTFGNTTLSFLETNKKANQVANGLKSLGIGMGDKVALSCFNSLDFPIIYFGIIKAGATVVPLSILLKPAEINYHLSDSDSVAYFCSEGAEFLPMSKMGHAGFQGVEHCKHFFVITNNPSSPSPFEGTGTLQELMAGQSTEFETALTNSEDTCVIIYTSGTTGRPKGAQLTHSNLLNNAIVSADLMDTRSHDRTLIVLPMFHIFAMSVMMNSTLYRGAHSILMVRFVPQDVLANLQKHKISVFGGVPTMYWALLNYEGDEFDYAEIAKNLKVAGSGGAALPVQVLKDFKEKFDVDILEGYGMSESSGACTFNHLEIGTKAGSIGTPVWGMEVKLVDSEGNEVPVGEKGELIYKGHSVMKGYYNRPKANAKTLKDGWLYSGDVAVKDEDGFYYIVDRTKDMIIRGGFNVYPRELEEVIIQHEAVSLVAVIGVPNDKMGEEVKAFVVLEKDATCTEQEIIQYAKSQLANYKYPRIVSFIDALPMSATGKILKKELRKL
ncbi:MAG: long-chain-fatty-acid--CoA ligase [Chitinophagales bacterium]